MDHYIETGEEKNRNKIESHLAKYIDVYSPAWVQTNGLFQKLRFDKFRGKVQKYLITTIIFINNMLPTIIHDIGGGNFQFLLTKDNRQQFHSFSIMLTIIQCSKLRSSYLRPKPFEKFKGTSKVDYERTQNIGPLYLCKKVAMNHINNITHINLFSCHAIKHLNLSYNDMPILHPYAKAYMNPPLLTINRMKLIGHVGKKDYIDTCLRRPLDSGLPRTKI